MMPYDGDDENALALSAWATVDKCMKLTDPRCKLFLILWDSLLMYSSYVK